MNKLKEGFPNPILAPGRDDYIDNCSFNTSFEESDITIDSEHIIINIKYILNCNGLKRLIEAGEAIVTVKVKSSAASFCEIYNFPSGLTEMKIYIPKFHVVNKIDLEGLIIATKIIDDFNCKEELNELYFKDIIPEIRKGDILAAENVHTIFLDNSELEKPISSIFSIKKNNDQDDDVIPYYADDKIEIMLKSELYELYYHFKDFNSGALIRYANGIIVYPVLVEAVGIVMTSLQNADDPEGDYSNKRWFRAIVHKATEKGKDLSENTESASTIANILLGDIALDALKSFKDTLECEINDEETQMIGGVD